LATAKMNSRQRDASFIEWLESCNIGSGFQKIFSLTNFPRCFHSQNGVCGNTWKCCFCGRKIAGLTVCSDTNQRSLRSRAPSTSSTCQIFSLSRFVLLNILFYVYFLAHFLRASLVSCSVFALKKTPRHLYHTCRHPPQVQAVALP
jgi:hypothetical protein